MVRSCGSLVTVTESDPALFRASLDGDGDGLELGIRGEIDLTERTVGMSKRLRVTSTFAEEMCGVTYGVEGTDKLPADDTKV